MSLQRRIQLLSVGAAAAVLVLFMIPAVLLLRVNASDRVLQGATDSARNVADYLSSQPSTGALEAYIKRANGRDDSYPVAVVRADGTVVGSTLPGLAVLSSRRSGDGDGDGDGDEAPGYGLTEVSDGTTLSVDGGRLVVVDVDHDPATAGIDQVAVLAANSRVWTAVGEQTLGLAGIAVAILVATAGASQRITRRLVANLASTAEVADALGQGNFDRRVPEDGPPEVRVVAQALNRLAGRIDELLFAERELVADLSHRLRTPLMALRLDVEGIARTGRDPDLAAELVAHVDELERSLTAIIHAARRTEREGRHPRCDVGTVVAEAVDFWRPLAEDQERSLRLDVVPDLPAARCSGDDLRAAVDALVANCLAHTDLGTSIRVTVRVASGDIEVDIADQGKGVSPDHVPRGRSDRGSTGLGLDIARTCAEASGGRLEVDRQVTADGSWAVVRLVLGPA